MHNEAKPHEANSFQEQIDWWSREIDLLPESSEEDNSENYREIAERITGAMGNDNFDQWYKDGDGDPWFVEAFNLASALELPPDISIGPDERDEAWQRLKALVSALKEKHVNDNEEAERLLEDTKSFYNSLDSYHKQ